MNRRETLKRGSIASKSSSIFAVVMILYLPRFPWTCIILQSTQRRERGMYLVYFQPRNVLLWAFINVKIGEEKENNEKRAQQPWEIRQGGRRGSSRMYLLDSSENPWGLTLST